MPLFLILYLASALPDSGRAERKRKGLKGGEQTINIYQLFLLLLSEKTLYIPCQDKPIILYSPVASRKGTAGDTKVKPKEYSIKGSRLLWST